mmetsp:Transcript_2220/g.9608  ORF Transcript_2220/g.9608 Transcript_2220/m.9608 type:complete len:346 (+) Transcript_2220:347-1384(+)
MPHSGLQSISGRQNGANGHRSRAQRKKSASKGTSGANRNLENEAAEGPRAPSAATNRRGLQSGSGKANSNANGAHLAPKSSAAEPSFVKKAHKKHRGQNYRHSQPNGDALPTSNFSTMSLDGGERRRRGTGKRQQGNHGQGMIPAHLQHAPRRGYEAFAPRPFPSGPEGMPPAAYNLPVLPMAAPGMIAQPISSGQLFMPVMYMGVPVPNCVTPPLGVQPRRFEIMIDSAKEKSFHRDDEVAGMAEHTTISPYSSSCASTASDASDEEDSLKEQGEVFEESDEDRRLVEAIEAAYRKADEELTRHAERSKEKATRRWLENRNREQQMQKNAPRSAAPAPQNTTAL